MLVLDIHFIGHEYLISGRLRPGQLSPFQIDKVFKSQYFVLQVKAPEKEMLWPICSKICIGNGEGVTYGHTNMPPEQYLHS